MPYIDQKQKRAYYKKWLAKNKGYQKEWARNNREKSRAATKKWRGKNKNYCHTKTIEWYKKNPWARHHAAAKNRCTNKKCEKFASYGGRGIKFLLTMAETKKLWERDGAEKMARASIDRINNDGNYEFFNCQFLEMSAHSRKSRIGRKRSEKSKSKMSASKKIK